MDYGRLISRPYSGFNDRDIDVLVAQMTEDVDWPNAWEGYSFRGALIARMDVEDPEGRSAEH
jgi:hypothetical protein